MERRHGPEWRRNEGHGIELGTVPTGELSMPYGLNLFTTSFPSLRSGSLRGSQDVVSVRRKQWVKRMLPATKEEWKWRIWEAFYLPEVNRLSLDISLPIHRLRLRTLSLYALRSPFHRVAGVNVVSGEGDRTAGLDRRECWQGEDMRDEPRACGLSFGSLSLHITLSSFPAPVSPGRSPMQLGTDSRWTFLGFS